jgi:hypothetical protein
MLFELRLLTLKFVNIFQLNLLRAVENFVQLLITNKG